jgi:hypothetical protein
MTRFSQTKLDSVNANQRRVEQCATDGRRRAKESGVSVLETVLYALYPDSQPATPVIEEELKGRRVSRSLRMDTSTQSTRSGREHVKLQEPR